MHQSLGWESLLGALQNAELSLKNHTDPRTDALMVMDAVRFEIEAAKAEQEAARARAHVEALERAKEEQFFCLQIQMHQEEQAKLSAVILDLRENLEKALQDLSKMGATVAQTQRQAHEKALEKEREYAAAALELKRQAGAEIQRLRLELEKERQRRNDIMACVSRP